MEVLSKMNVILVPKEKLIDLNLNGSSLVIFNKKELSKFPFLYQRLDVVDFDIYVLIIKYIDNFDKNKIKIIENTVLDYFDLTVEELSTKTKKRHLSEPRQVLHYYLYKFCSHLITHEMIAEKYGGLDHATSIHSSKKINRLLEARDKKICKYIYDLNNTFNQLNL